MATDWPQLKRSEQVSPLPCPVSLWHCLLAFWIHHVMWFHNGTLDYMIYLHADGIIQTIKPMYLLLQYLYCIPVCCKRNYFPFCSGTSYDTSKLKAFFAMSHYRFFFSSAANFHCVYLNNYLFPPTCLWSPDIERLRRRHIATVCVLILTILGRFVVCSSTWHQIHNKML